MPRDQKTGRFVPLHRQSAEPPAKFETVGMDGISYDDDGNADVVPPPPWGRRPVLGWLLVSLCFVAMIGGLLMASLDKFR